VATTQTQTEPLITIENKRRRMKVYNLAGEHMRGRSDFGYQRIGRTETVHNPKTGAVATKVGRASVPTSITFTAREKRENLPSALLQCPEVKAAWERGDLKVTFQDGPIETTKGGASPRKTDLQMQKERQATIAAKEANHAKSLAEKEAEKDPPKPRGKKSFTPLAEKSPSSAD
jgi:hypothetical protein